MKGRSSSRAAANNRSNQMNPNNATYWSSRGTSPAATPATSHGTTPPPAAPEGRSGEPQLEQTSGVQKK